MKTIGQHNADKYKLREEILSIKTDIECPICKKELIYADNCTYTSDPPQRAVKCNCGYYGYVLA